MLHGVSAKTFVGNLGSPNDQLLRVCFRSFSVFAFIVIWQERMTGHGRKRTLEIAIYQQPERPLMGKAVTPVLSVLIANRLARNTVFIAVYP
jgi:hypothetical protein